MKACRSVENRHRLKRIRLSRTAWYYEEKHGLTVVAERRTSDGSLLCVIQTKLPWAKLITSVDRHQGKEDK